MGRPTDKSTNERLWLVSRIQGFYDSRETGQVKAFFNGVFEEWLQTHPIKTGLPPKETADLRKAACDRVKAWFYNNADKYALGTLPMPEGIEQPTKKSSDYIMRASAMKKSKDKDGDLDLLKKDDKKAGMQEHQVYQIMFRQLIQQRTQNEYEEYAKRVEEAGGTPEKSLYRAYVAEQTALGKEPSKFIQWNTHRIVAIFKEEDPDVKERVAATLKAYRDGDIYKISPDTEDEDESHPETDEEANKDDEEHEKGILFRRINAIPKVLNRILVNLHEQTGWSGAFLVGGPDVNGEVVSCIFAHGQTKHTAKNWPDSDPQFYPHVVGSFDRYLQLVYPEAKNGDAAKGQGTPSVGEASSHFKVVVDTTQSFRFDSRSETSASTPGTVKSTPSSSKQPLKKGKGRFRRRFVESDDSSEEQFHVLTEEELIDLDDDGGSVVSETIAEVASNPSIKSAATKTKKTTVDRRTIYEKERDAKIRFVKAKFALHGKFGENSREMKSIDAVLAAGYVPDIDDYDIPATLLRLANLPVIKGLTDDAMRAMHDTILTRPIQSKASRLSKAKKSVPSGPPRRSPRSISSSSTASDIAPEESPGDTTDSLTSRPSAESNVSTESSETLTPEGDACGTADATSSASSSFAEVSSSADDSAPSLALHLMTEPSASDEDAGARESSPVVDTVTVEPVETPASDEDFGMLESSSAVETVTLEPVEGTEQEHHNDPSRDHTDYTHRGTHSTPPSQQGHPPSPPRTRKVSARPVALKKSRAAANAQSASIQPGVAKTTVQADENRNGPDSRSSASQIAKETVQASEGVRTRKSIRAPTNNKMERREANEGSSSLVDPDTNPGTVSTARKAEEASMQTKDSQCKDRASLDDWLDRGAEVIINAWPNAASWKRFVDNWKRFEKEHPGQEGDGFPLNHAPDEVVGFLMIFANADDAPDIPEVADADYIAPNWWSWWRSLQPEWRLLPKHTDKLAQQVPDGEDLSCLCRTGRKGMFAALLGLAIWASAITHSESAKRSFKNAKADIEWVLLQLSCSHDVLKGRKATILESDAASKRKADVNTEGRPSTKKPRRGARSK